MVVPGVLRKTPGTTLILDSDIIGDSDICLGKRSFLVMGSPISGTAGNLWMVPAVRLVDRVIRWCLQSLPSILFLR